MTAPIPPAWTQQVVTHPRHSAWREPDSPEDPLLPVTHKLYCTRLERHWLGEERGRHVPELGWEVEYRCHGYSRGALGNLLVDREHQGDRPQGGMAEVSSVAISPVQRVVWEWVQAVRVVPDNNVHPPAEIVWRVVGHQCVEVARTMESLLLPAPALRAAAWCVVARVQWPVPRDADGSWVLRVQFYVPAAPVIVTAHAWLVERKLFDLKMLRGTQRLQATRGRQEHWYQMDVLFPPGVEPRAEQCVVVAEGWSDGRVWHSRPPTGTDPSWDAYQQWKAESWLPAPRGWTRYLSQFPLVSMVSEDPLHPRRGCARPGPWQELALTPSQWQDRSRLRGVRELDLATICAEELDVCWSDVQVVWGGTGRVAWIWDTADGQLEKGFRISAEKDQVTVVRMDSLGICAYNCSPRAARGPWWRGHWMQTVPLTTAEHRWRWTCDHTFPVLPRNATGDDLVTVRVAENRPVWSSLYQIPIPFHITSTGYWLRKDGVTPVWNAVGGDTPGVDRAALLREALDWEHGPGKGAPLQSYRCVVDTADPAHGYKLHANTLSRHFPRLQQQLMAWHRWRHEGPGARLYEQLLQLGSMEGNPAVFQARRQMLMELEGYCMPRKGVVDLQDLLVVHMHAAMGSGKTTVSFRGLQPVLDRAVMLVLCPRISLLHNYVRDVEARLFGNQPHVPGRVVESSDQDRVPTAQVVITTPHSIAKVAGMRKPSVVIVDELKTVAEDFAAHYFTENGAHLSFNDVLCDLLGNLQVRMLLTADAMESLLYSHSWLPSKIPPNRRVQFLEVKNPQFLSMKEPVDALTFAHWGDVTDEVVTAASAPPDQEDGRAGAAVFTCTKRRLSQLHDATGRIGHMVHGSSKRATKRRDVGEELQRRGLWLYNMSQAQGVDISVPTRVLALDMDPAYSITPQLQAAGRLRNVRDIRLRVERKMHRLPATFPYTMRDVISDTGEWMKMIRGVCAVTGVDPTWINHGINERLERTGHGVCMDQVIRMLQPVMLRAAQANFTGHVMNGLYHARICVRDPVQEQREERKRVARAFQENDWVAFYRCAMDAYNERMDPMGPLARTCRAFRLDPVSLRPMQAVFLQWGQLDRVIPLVVAFWHLQQGRDPLVEMRSRDAKLDEHARQDPTVHGCLMVHALRELWHWWPSLPAGMVCWTPDRLAPVQSVRDLWDRMPAEDFATEVSPAWQASGGGRIAGREEIRTRGDLVRWMCVMVNISPPAHGAFAHDEEYFRLLCKVTNRATGCGDLLPEEQWEPDSDGKRGELLFPCEQRPRVPDIIRYQYLARMKDPRIPQGLCTPVPPLVRRLPGQPPPPRDPDVPVHCFADEADLVRECWQAAQEAAQWELHCVHKVRPEGLPSLADPEEEDAAQDEDEMSE